MRQVAEKIAKCNRALKFVYILGKTLYIKSVKQACSIKLSSSGFEDNVIDNVCFTNFIYKVLPYVLCR